MIPEAAVEAAAFVISYRISATEDDWQTVARAALEAAAPHMLALGPHPTWGSEVNPANNAHIAYCSQCRANFGGGSRG